MDGNTSLHPAGVLGKLCSVPAPSSLLPQHLHVSFACTFTLPSPAPLSLLPLHLHSSFPYTFTHPSPAPSPIHPQHLHPSFPCTITLPAPCSFTLPAPAPSPTSTFFILQWRYLNATKQITLETSQLLSEYKTYTHTS